MNEGRAELQRVILQYEKQRAEAIRDKQEAEIVLPFVRAALEELDAALGQSERDESDNERMQTKRNAARQQSRSRPAQHSVEAEDDADEDFGADEFGDEELEATETRRSAAAVFGVSDEDAEESDAEDMPSQPGFNRSSIASLIDQSGKKEKTG